MQWKQKSKNTRGAALVEYVVLMGIVGGLAIFAIMDLGASVDGAYDTIDTSVSDQIDKVIDPTDPGGGNPGGGGPTPPTGPIIAQIDGSYTVPCTGTLVSDIGDFVTSALNDYFVYPPVGNPGGSSRFSAWNTMFYEQGQDPSISVSDFYDRSIDWSTVPNWQIVDTDVGPSSFQLIFGPDNSTVLYNPLDGADPQFDYGWQRPGYSSCLEGTSGSTTYTLEAVHPSGTILRFVMAVDGTSMMEH